VVVGGIIPPNDADTLESFGVAAVYTPKHFRLNTIMGDIVLLLDRPAKAAGGRSIGAARPRAPADGNRRDRSLHAGAVPNSIARLKTIGRDGARACSLARGKVGRWQLTRSL